VSIVVDYGRTYKLKEMEIMIPHFFKTVKRSLSRNRLFSVINVLGLAIGIAACTLATFFIQDELSYDNQTKDAFRIFRIVTDMGNGAGMIISDATTPSAIASSVSLSIPEVEAVTRIFHSNENAFFVRSENAKFLEENLYHVDSNFFNFFPTAFLYGNASTALQNPHSVILTATSAKKYFGNQNPIGKVLQIDDWEPEIVMAVVKDPPSNMHFSYNILCPISRFLQRDSWSWSAFYTYIKLQSGVHLSNVNAKITNLVKKDAPDNKNHFLLQALTSIHLDSDRKSELMPNGDRSYLYIIATLGVLVLFIACVNFVNLSLAQSSLRAKEIGIRKISGAKQKTLLGQFLLESLVISLLAASVALLLSWIALPLLNHLSGKELTFSDHWTTMLGLLLLFSIVLGILAGLYPSLVLASLKPTLVLKGTTTPNSSGFPIRKVLVISQFAMSIALIVGTIVARQQIRFVQNAHLGFTKDNVLTVTAPYFLSSSSKTLKDEWLQIPGVLKVSRTNGIIPELTWDLPVNGTDGETELLLRGIQIDSDYLACLGIPLIAGTNWLSERDSGTITNVILNETAVRQLHIKEPVVGQILIQPALEKRPNSFLRVQGIVRDFHFSSFKSAIEPFAFQKIRKVQSNFVIKIQGTNALPTMKALERVWDRNVDNWPFQYRFMDDSFARLYKTESNFFTIFLYLTLLAIFTACLGLFGLSTFMINQRVKEIGIRKVLGGSVIQIFQMLTGDIAKLVIFAGLIAIPVSGWIMSSWLEQFAYHTIIQWWFFGIAIILALLVAFLSVSYQVIKAAMANPISALREE
jgi:putative ABC transport system permease protein